MSSQRQIDANRNNAARSRGTITPKGKLASQVIIFDGESAERFNALHDSLITEFQSAYRTLSDEARFDHQLSRAIQRFNEVRASRKEKKVIFPNDPNSRAKLK
jgi:hypothetical protein